MWTGYAVQLTGVCDDEYPLRYAMPVASGIHLGPQCSLVRLHLGVRRMHLSHTIWQLFHLFN